MRVRRSECLAVIGIGILGIIVSMSQTMIDVSRTPSGTVFPFVHNYAQDYYYYLHLMRQGFDGAWLATSKLTEEQFPVQFVNPFFLLLGHLSRLTNVSLPHAYLIARIVGAVSLIALSYVLALLVYPRSSLKRIVALLLVVFGSYWWSWQEGSPGVPSLVHLWTELDPMVRLSFIPHHLWSKIFMLATFLLILRFSTHTVRLNILVLVVLGTLFAGFSSPVVLMTLIPTLLFFIVLLLIGTLREKKMIPWRTYVLIVLSIVVGILVVIYHRHVETGVFPWTSYKSWEDTVRFSIRPIDYLESLGPTLLFFLFAIVPLWRTPAGKLVLAWAASGWIMTFAVGRFIPIWNIRFLEGYQFIPIAIGASEGLLIAAGLLRTYVRLRFPLVILFVLLFIHAGGGIIASTNEHNQYLVNDVYNPMIYIPVSTFKALTYLSTVGQGDRVVMAPFDIGSMIPAYSKLRVVGGHNLMTFDAPGKRTAIDMFYRLSDSAIIATELTRLHVRYIWRPQWVPVAYDIIPNVKKIFDSQTVTLYEVGQ